jgi:probable 2-oxoglutarate dehydrogenase E1 component DHKTD1
MGKKFPQVKRYGLEGAESMLVALDAILKQGNFNKLEEIIVCMPHRGIFPK